MFFVTVETQLALGPEDGCGPEATEAEVRRIAFDRIRELAEQGGLVLAIEEEEED